MHTSLEGYEFSMIYDPTIAMKVEEASSSVEVGN